MLFYFFFACVVVSFIDLIEFVFIILASINIDFSKLIESISSNKFRRIKRRSKREIGRKTRRKRRKR